MGKRPETTNTGEGGKGEKVRTTSGDAGGKSVSSVVWDLYRLTCEGVWRFFSRVGLVQTDFHGRLLDTTMIDLMWAKQAP